MSDFFNAQKAGHAVDLEDSLDATFLEHVRDLVGSGALVSVGTTRDGGALSLTITYDGQWRREYLTATDEVHEYLKLAAVTINELASRAPAPTSTVQRRRSRRGP